MSKKKRIETGGGDPLTHNPFGGLDSLDLPEGPVVVPPKPVESKRSKPNKNRGRVDIIRQTAHRGGKTVTVVTNFVGIGMPEKEALAKKMQKACGTGGTVKGGNIEIQGERREQVAEILKEAGFRPVFAGG
ncbi:translation initiation factor [bacterium]|jgi:translation initiation factor 1|nr:translation initiation factor [bacterium]